MAKRGELNVNAKLTEAVIRQIRYLYGIKGVTQATLAKMFNVDKHTMNDIVHERSWRWLN